MLLAAIKASFEDISCRQWRDTCYCMIQRSVLDRYIAQTCQRSRTLNPPPVSSSRHRAHTELGGRVADFTRAEKMQGADVWTARDHCIWLLQLCRAAIVPRRQEWSRY